MGSNEANHYFGWLVVALMRTGIDSKLVMTELHLGKLDTMPLWWHLIHVSVLLLCSCDLCSIENFRCNTASHYVFKYADVLQ